MKKAQRRGGLRPPIAGALRTRVMLFFARNPDELLSAEDAALKWGVSKERVRKALYDLHSRNLLAVHSRGAKNSGRNPYNIYTAGPALLEAIEQ